MTTAKNKSVDTQVRNKAADMAVRKEENIVVYTTGAMIGKPPKLVHFLTPLSTFKSSVGNPKVIFVATIDKLGNYVD